MSKRVLAIVIAIAVLIVGGVAALALTRSGEPTAQVQSSESPGAESSTVETPAPADPTEAATPTTDTAGAYVEYTESAIADAEGTVLLFFHATWCSQCRSIESDILAEGVPAGVTIVKVDYDSHQDLRQQYGVTLQTTFVEVDENGSELQKFVAYDDPSLSAVVAAML